MNHGISISPNANACINGIVADYFGSGVLPKQRRGVDATCKANPNPVPTEPPVLTTAGDDPLRG